jgi:hypothetical protein
MFLPMNQAPIDDSEKAEIAAIHPYIVSSHFAMVPCHR